MISAKSISRFDRNTLDCFRHIRKLKDKNIAVFFEKEGINTLDAKGEVVKRIYRECLKGYSMDKIKKGLKADGIRNGAGNLRWHTSNIKQILANEKYISDALLQKTYTTDFLNKTIVKNNGIMPQYYVEWNHEAIIPKEIFLRVQDELVRRSTKKVSANGRKISYSCQHYFSQLIYCGECGEMFRRLHWNNVSAQ